MSGSNRRSHYTRIPPEVRTEMIDRVIHQKQSLKTVADELSLNVSTCKAILKVYMSEGRIGKKQKRNKVLNVFQTVSFVDETEDGPREIMQPRFDEWRFAFERGEDHEQALLRIAEEKSEGLREEFSEAMMAPENSSQEQNAPQMLPMQLTYLNGLLFSMFGRFDQGGNSNSSVPYPNY